MAQIVIRGASIWFLSANWFVYAESIDSESQYQIQLLRQEVMELRGLIENLDYEIKRQKAVADDRYLELDFFAGEDTLAAFNVSDLLRSFYFEML